MPEMNSRNWRMFTIYASAFVLSALARCMSIRSTIMPEIALADKYSESLIAPATLTILLDDLLMAIELAACLIRQAYINFLARASPSSLWPHCLEKCTLHYRTLLSLSPHEISSYRASSQEAFRDITPFRYTVRLGGSPRNLPSLSTGGQSTIIFMPFSYPCRRRESSAPLFHDHTAAGAWHHLRRHYHGYPVSTMIHQMAK